MANRDQDDSQYDRNEGRYENRDEWRDVSNAGSREWDRRGDDFRQDRGYGSSSRNYQPGSFEERREQRLAQQDFGRSGQDYRSDGYRGSDYRQGSYGQDSSRQQYGQSSYGQDSNRQYGQGRYGQGQYDQGQYDQGQFRGPNAQYGQYGQSSSGQEWRGQGSNDWSRYQGAYGQGYERSRFGSYDQDNRQDWGRSQYGQDQDRNPYYRTDYSRSQSNYGARDATRSDLGGWSSGQTYGQQSNYGSPYQSGQYREGREEESWGQQIRHAGQQAARSIKRAFRGPKNYKRSDERIREDVSDRLGLSERLDPSEIEVSVSNGEVTLSGTVQSRGEKYLAEEIADDVSGVNEVNNQLRVRREDSATTSSSTSSLGSTTSTSATESTLRNRNARA